MASVRQYLFGRIQDSPKDLLHLLDKCIKLAFGSATVPTTASNRELTFYCDSRRFKGFKHSFLNLKHLSQHGGSQKFSVAPAPTDVFELRVSGMTLAKTKCF